jgi:hypothetical protein
MSFRADTRWRIMTMARNYPKHAAGSGHGFTCRGLRRVYNRNVRVSKLLHIQGLSRYLSLQYAVRKAVPTASGMSGAAGISSYFFARFILLRVASRLREPAVIVHSNCRTGPELAQSPRWLSQRGRICSRMYQINGLTAVHAAIHRITAYAELCTGESICKQFIKRA